MYLQLIFIKSNEIEDSSLPLNKDVKVFPFIVILQFIVSTQYF